MMTSLKDTTVDRTFGHTDDVEKEASWRRKDTVEFWMSSGATSSEFSKLKKSIWVSKDRLFQLGMKSYPEVVDLTQASESVSQILEQLLIGNRRYSAYASMAQAAELCHLAMELNFTNLLKIVEQDLVRQKCETMEHAVDALSVAMRYGMRNAVEKLVDEIVFGFQLDEQFLIYSKNQAAVEMVLNRKAELEGYGRQEPYFETYEDVGEIQNQNPNIWNQEQGHSNHNQQALLPRVPQNGQMHKVFFNAAKEKFRTILNRPMNSVRNGIAWVSAQNQRRRGPPRHQNHRVDDFPEFLNL